MDDLRGNTKDSAAADEDEHQPVNKTPMRPSSSATPHPYPRRHEDPSGEALPTSMKHPTSGAKPADLAEDQVKQLKAEFIAKADQAEKTDAAVDKNTLNLLSGIRATEL